MQAPNGSYTRFPNVTFELFDIFNLLDSERCFFMWFFKEYHHRGPYVGSLRDLTKLTGRSKSNVDRIIKRLEETGLLRVSTEGKQTIIEVEELALWAWNRVASMGQVVPTTGHNVPSVGQVVPPTGHDVPQTGQQWHVNEHEKQVHTVGINSNKEINKTNKERTNTPSVSPSSLDSSSDDGREQSPTIWTPEEETLLQWLDSAKIGWNKNDDVVKGQLKELVPVISSIEKLHKLIDVAKIRIQGDDKTVYLGNLVGNTLKAWLQQQEPEEEQPTPPAPGTQTSMSIEQCEELEREMLRYCPLLVTGICETDGIYTVGLARGDNDWIDIWSPEDWCRLSNETVDQCIAFGEAVRQPVAI